MDEERCWQVVDGVLVEEFPDEIICMQVDDGVFYSLRGTAVAVWRACARGVPVDALTIAVPEDQREAIAEMVEQLRNDALLTVVDGPGADLDPGEFDGADAAEWVRNAELSDLIRLDPIHDVTERGWPFA